MTIARARQLHAESVAFHKEAVRRKLDTWAAAYWKRLASLKRIIERAG